MHMHAGAANTLCRLLCTKCTSCPPPPYVATALPLAICCSTCRRRAAATAPLSLSYSVACLSLPTVISFSYLSLQQSRKERTETRNESGHVLTSEQPPLLPKGRPRQPPTVLYCCHCCINTASHCLA